MHPCPTVSNVTDWQRGDGSVNHLMAHLALSTWMSHQKHCHYIGLITQVCASVHWGAGGNTKQLHRVTELCWVSPLGQRIVTGSLDIEVSRNSKKQQTALERKGLTCTSTCGQNELWLGGSINYFAFASYSLYCATLILSLWLKAVYSYWLSQKPEDSFQVSFLCSFCL